ncbi:hypothetical protein HY797_01455, partial [Candidatus Falkowbacteria bacterium]|nr:hypothetical protein [Candidatus Falkowbacteria bacterium]
GPVASACGTCCCDPSANPDTCKSLNPLLVCKPNQAPCDGVKRGLCCGCSQDSQCGDANANANGCGTDTCCQARPSVLDPTIPADGADNVCRNTLIQATFDQSMDIATFSSNVIVAGEYGTDQCPANTRYLTAAYKPSLFAKLVNWLGKLPLINKIFINQAQALTGNFCVVTGQVSGIIKGVGSNKTTDLEFRMQKVLEANKKYYVIIKGDSDVTDAIRNGVLSQAGIGMKGEGYNSESSVIFNGLTFANAKIWSFTTMGENEVNAGICPIDNVQIEPSSYLLQTDENDTKDDSPTNTTTFDTIADSDKAFVAQAYASNGQLLTATTDYSWTWTWISASPTIATAVKLAEPEPFIAVVTAQKGVADGQTKITATASLSGTTITKQGGATVYVVLCKNIWPPFSTDIDGNSIWAPWKEPTNCTVPNFGCSETNFALYYCRDSGGPGTADDLPAILSDTVVTRGSNLKCNDGTGSCVGRNKGDNCVDGSGICIIDILKEFYFFREDMPNVAGDFIVSALPQGGGAAASWNGVAGATGYKVYYGVASGNYINSVDAGTALSKEITGLTNGLKYYFALTSYNTQKAESGYSNEVMAIPNDTWAPQTPQNLSGAAGVGKAVIAWDANTDDTAIYKIYYGASVDVNGAPIYGTSVNLDKSKCSAAVGDIPGECEIIISNLTAGITYYFAAAALDLKANESNKSAKIDLTIL